MPSRNTRRPARSSGRGPARSSKSARDPSRPLTFTERHRWLMPTIVTVAVLVVVVGLVVALADHIRLF